MFSITSPIVSNRRYPGHMGLSRCSGILNRGTTMGNGHWEYTGFSGLLALGEPNGKDRLGKLQEDPLGREFRGCPMGPGQVPFPQWPAG